MLGLLLAGTASGQQPIGTPYPSYNPPPVPVPVSVQPRPLPSSMDAGPLPQSVPVAQPAAPSSGILRTQMEPPGLGYLRDDPQTTTISLDPPGPERVVQLQSEAQTFLSWTIKAKEKGERLTFPDPPVLSREPYLGRNWAERICYCEPNYVNYGRLMFEEVNSERYGWDLGLAGVVVSSGYFLKDMALMPYHRFTDPWRWMESSAGQCLPGDPVPYNLYPVGLSYTGAVAEAATIVTLIAIFP